MRQTASKVINPSDRIKGELKNTCSTSSRDVYVYIAVSGSLYIPYRGHRESQGTEKPPCQCETDHKRKFYFLPSSTAIFENGMIDKKGTRVLKIIF